MMMNNILIPVIVIFFTIGLLIFGFMVVDVFYQYHKLKKDLIKQLEDAKSKGKI